MPKCFSSPDERRAYYRDWFRTEKGMACRRRTIVEGAVKHRRCPARTILAKYDISGDDLERILHSIKHESD